MVVTLRRALLSRVPAFARSYAQAEDYAARWAADNTRALGGSGPLWVVLGDSAALGVGAPAHDRGYVGQVRSLLEARDGVRWRVVNLAVSGARTRGVLTAQLPALEPWHDEAALVSAVVGGNDALGTPVPEWERDVASLAAALPPGALLATVAQGVRARRTVPVNALVRELAGRHGHLLADLWAHTGPPYRGLYADGFHPNEAGYRQWTAAIAEALDLDLVSPG